jgi:uncharacterized protein involved in type VI secretion and phage assembly
MNGNGTNQCAGPFNGKFRGIVTDNEDPSKLGRIRAKVQDVFGENESGWAMPAVPYAGKNVGFFLIPPKDAFVWIEFEHGDPEYPIWTGCFWAQGEVPVSPAVPDTKMLKTDIATITINDSASSGSVTIETNKGMKIVMDTSSIEITNGQGASVKWSGNQVSVNSGALEVT